ncbi:MAG: tyrosine-type recombinase/integrase [Pseudomonadota bacterium]
MDQLISEARSHIPPRKTRRKTKKDTPTKFFTMGEIKALLNEVSFNHGLRSSEAALLQWEDISFDDNTISITRLKGGAAETLHPTIEDDYRVLLDLKKMYERKGVFATREVFKIEKRRGYIKVKKQRWFTKDGEERWGETYSAPGLSDLLKRIIRRCDGLRAARPSVPRITAFMRHLSSEVRQDRAPDLAVARAYLGPER